MADANIEVLTEERLPENAAARGEQIMSRLRAFQERCPLIGDVRGKGLMIGAELIEDEEKTPAARQAAEVRRLCREDGVLIGVGGSLANVVRLQPPLVITEEETDRVLDVLEKALTQVAGT